jgi:hypothetical protein
VKGNEGNEKKQTKNLKQEAVWAVMRHVGSINPFVQQYKADTRVEGMSRGSQQGI